MNHLAVLSLFYHWLPSFVLGISVFLVFWLVARLINILISRLAKRSNPNQAFVLNWLRQLAKNTLIGVGVITALAYMGVNVNAVVASLGLTGVALGLAMKESLANVLAGTLILVYPPFHLRDFIKVAGFEGQVFAINMRYTILNSQNQTILIPNMLILTQPVIIVQQQENE